jgi:hypothetical protein
MKRDEDPRDSSAAKVKVVARPVRTLALPPSPTAILVVTTVVDLGRYFVLSTDLNQKPSLSEYVHSKASPAVDQRRASHNIRQI